MVNGSTSFVSTSSQRFIQKMKSSKILFVLNNIIYRIISIIKSDGGGPGTIDRNRFGLQCYLCGFSDIRIPCLTCDYHNCPLNYHIRCGIEKGIIKNQSLIPSEIWDPTNKYNFAIFCEKHEIHAISSIRNGFSTYATIVKNQPVQYPLVPVKKKKKKSKTIIPKSFILD